MALTTWLVDKSALVRLAPRPDVQEWVGRISRGLDPPHDNDAARSRFSARSGSDLRKAFDLRPALMPVEYLTPTMEQRAIEVQALLADQGRHRTPAVSDLRLAATAEWPGLSVLQNDKDSRVDWPR